MRYMYSIEKTFRVNLSYVIREHAIKCSLFSLVVLIFLNILFYQFTTDLQKFKLNSEARIR